MSRKFQLKKPTAASVKVEMQRRIINMFLDQNIDRLTI